MRTRARPPEALGIERGSSAVEFAIILPLLLLVLFGIIDFGRLEFERITVNQAAFEGARASGFKQGVSAITTAVHSTLGSSDVTITTVNANCATPNSMTTVTVAKQNNFLWYTPVLRGISVQVKATGAFRCLN